VAPLRLPDQTPRSQAMRLAMPGRYLHSAKFQFGEDLYGAPGNSRFDESSEHFELHMRYSNEARQQTIAGELRVLSDAVAAGQWSRFRDQLNKVAPRLSNSFSVPTLSPMQTAVHSRLLVMPKTLAAGRPSCAPSPRSRLTPLWRPAEPGP